MFLTSDSVIHAEPYVLFAAVTCHVNALNVHLLRQRAQI